MKFAIACAMLLALLGRPAAAADDRALLPVPAPTASTPASAPASTAEPVLALTHDPIAVTSATTSAPAPTGPSSALPSAPDAIITLKTPPRTHKFFDARNSMGLASMAVTLSVDALSTQKGLAYPGFSEMNPIARPFVQSRAGAAVYSAGSFALLAGTMYAAHKTRHHRLERILPFAVAGWEGLLSFRNYRVIAAHR